MTTSLHLQQKPARRLHLQHTPTRSPNHVWLDSICGKASWGLWSRSVSCCISSYPSSSPSSSTTSLLFLSSYFLSFSSRTCHSLFFSLPSSHFPTFLSSFAALAGSQSPLWCELAPLTSLTHTHTHKTFSLWTYSQHTMLFRWQQ